MEGGKRNANSMANNNNTNNNNTNNDSGLRLYDPYVPILVSPIPVHPSLPSCSYEDGQNHSKRLRLDDGGDTEGSRPLNQSNGSNHLPEVQPVVATAAGSAAIASSSSFAVENPPPEAAVFDSELVTNRRLAPTRSYSYLSPAESEVMDYATYMNLKVRQLTQLAACMPPEIINSLRFELSSQILYYDMMLRHAATMPSTRQNENAEDGDGEDEDEDDWDTDSDDTDYDDDDDDDELAEEGVSLGLTEEQIVNTLKTEKYNSTTTDTNTCSICWDELYKEGEDIGRLDCDHNHKFHIDCIKSWLSRQNTCPLCRMKGLIL